MKKTLRYAGIMKWNFKTFLIICVLIFGVSAYLDREMIFESLGIDTSVIDVLWYGIDDPVDDPVETIIVEGDGDGVVVTVTKTTKDVKDTWMIIDNSRTEKIKYIASRFSMQPEWKNISNERIGSYDYRKRFQHTSGVVLMQFITNYRNPSNYEWTILKPHTIHLDDDESEVMQTAFESWKKQEDEDNLSKIINKLK